jgi:hypothetical protein
MIHKSSSLFVWNSSWVPTLPFFSPNPLPMSKTSFLDLNVSDFITSNGFWNLSLLIFMFTPSSVKEILKIPINHNLASPFLWTPSSNSLFSTCSAYRLISSPSIISVSSPLESSSWKSLWKLKLKALFHIPASESLCPLCSTKEESLSHLFFNCIFARVAWRSSFLPRS